MIMYALVWASFFQIFLIVLLLSILPGTGLVYNITIGVHILLGLAVISLAFLSSRTVAATRCPNRIKRISRATAILAGVQGLLGVILFLLIRFNQSITLQNVVLLMHIVIALAIIAQASSAATAFDMWEEREFETKTVPSVKS
jgi:heme A synthase